MWDGDGKEDYNSRPVGSQHAIFHCLLRCLIPQPSQEFLLPSPIMHGASANVQWIPLLSSWSPDCPGLLHSPSCPACPFLAQQHTRHSMPLPEPPSLLPAQLLRGGSLEFPVRGQENVEENRTPQSQKPALEKEQRNHYCHPLIQVTGTIILWHKYLPDSALLICHKQRFGRFKADVGGILKGSRRWRQPEVMSGLLLSCGILTYISQTRYSDPSPAPETQS